MSLITGQAKWQPLLKVNSFFVNLQGFSSYTYDTRSLLYVGFLYIHKTQTVYFIYVKKMYIIQHFFHLYAFIQFLPCERFCWRTPGG